LAGDDDFIAGAGGDVARSGSSLAACEQGGAERKAKGFRRQGYGGQERLNV